MKRTEILKRRRELAAYSGRGEFFFFPSILISAAAFCAVICLGVHFFMSTPEVSQAYSSAVLDPALKIPNFGGYPFLDVLQIFIERFLSAFLKGLVSFSVFYAVLIFLLLPIYQGTVRWCAYLVEEEKALPISAITFYFSSPSLYFKSVLLSIRIFIRKAFFAFLFLFPPLFCAGISLIVGSDYFGEKTLAAASLILSLLWSVFALILYFIYCQKYAAVRYLFALGESRKIFKRSALLTAERRGFLFTFNLLLSANLLLVLGIVTAPYALSRIISAQSLMIKALISEKRKTA